MSGWFYQVNGFELGPVPTPEIQRLLQKGRIAPDTPVRREGDGSWRTADRLPVADDPAPRSMVAAIRSRPAPRRRDVLDRFAVLGIPIGVALILPRDGIAHSLGLVILAPSLAALIHRLVKMTDDLRALRETAGLGRSDDDRDPVDSTRPGQSGRS